MAPMLYPFVMGLAIAASFWASRITQSRIALSPHERIAIGIGAFCGAMLGAKLPFVLSDMPGFLSGWAWVSSGKTILTGLAGGYLGVELVKWALSIQTRTGDSFAVPVALGIAIGRVGCFVGGCCFGEPTSLPWGVVFPTADSLPRHPTQLYEAFFHFAMAGVLFAMWRRGIFRNHLIKFYIIVYAIYRFVTEFIRPEERIWQSLTGYQWSAAAMIGMFGLLWAYDAWHERKEALLKGEG